MNLKKLLGTQSYWVINKELAKELGLEATVVLQHLIDLQSEFFKNGDFHQSQSRLLNDLPITRKGLIKAVKLLKDKGFISVEKKGIPATNYYTVNDRNILSFLDGTTSDPGSGRLEIPDRDDTHKELKTLRIKNTKLDDVSSDTIVNESDIKGKIFFKLVEQYQQNRIGNRQHGLKKFKQLDMQDCKLALLNVKRYLKAVDSRYVKSLQNYIQEGCYKDEWLKLEENKSKKSNINNTKKFDANYDNIS